MNTLHAFVYMQFICMSSHARFMINWTSRRKICDIFDCKKSFSSFFTTGIVIIFFFFCLFNCQSFLVVNFQFRKQFESFYANIPLFTFGRHFKFSADSNPCSKTGIQYITSTGKLRHKRKHSYFVCVSFFQKFVPWDQKIYIYLHEMEQTSPRKVSINHRM